VSGDTRADAAVKSILLRLFGNALLNEKRILEKDSPVAIHAFRVALRRSRSLLAFSHGILPESRIRSARKTLAWVMADSNVIRDRQVMQEKLKNSAPELPRQCRKTFLAFRQVLQEDIAHELVHLRKQLQANATRLLNRVGSITCASSRLPGPACILPALLFPEYQPR